MRSTGGNRFIPADATYAELVAMIQGQLLHLHHYAMRDGKVLDLAEVTIETSRIPDGRISVLVSADLQEVEA